MSNGVGDGFQKETMYSRDKLFPRYLDSLDKPSTYKHFPNSRIIELPRPEIAETMSFDEALHKRRSVRGFSTKPMSQSQLSYLLWASTGIQRKSGGYEFRTAPSAGALYPIETYLILNNVERLEKGLFHYSVERHCLEELKKGDFDSAIAQAALNQKMFLSAAAVFVWTAVFDRSKWKYSQRAYRYVYLDAGHIAQNLALAATVSGLGSCQVGAFFDEEVNTIVGVDGEVESTIYLSLIGYPIRRGG